MMNRQYSIMTCYDNELNNEPNDDDFSDGQPSDDDVGEDMAALMNINPICKEKLRKIPHTNTYANSVNVYVGRPRSGKTYLALHDIISVIRNDPNVHMLVYVNDKGESDDETFQRFEELITVPIVYVSYDNCEEYLRQLLDYKAIYNKIMTNNYDKRQIPTEVIEDLFSHLCIEDFDRPYLQTLILTEDATNSKVIRKADSYINDLLTRCAHTQFSFFILIHFWKALTTNIKANLSTIYIFGGYSRQQLSYMLYQIAIPTTVKELFTQYSKMKRYDKLMIDCNSGNYRFI